MTLHTTPACSTCFTTFTADTASRAWEMHAEHHEGMERRAARRAEEQAENDRVLTERYAPVFVQPFLQWFVLAVDTVGARYEWEIFHADSAEQVVETLEETLGLDLIYARILPA